VSAREVTGLDGERLVEVTVLVVPNPLRLGHDWNWTDIDNSVRSAVAQYPGLELAEDAEVRHA
jgi:hypothetical protein